jgi:hypothetical protein
MTEQYTTDYFESLELIEAGLDRETADFYFPAGCKESVVPIDGTPLTTEVRSWSIMRLWDLLHKAGIYFYQYDTGDTPEHIMGSLVYAVERAVRKGGIKKK